MRYLLILTLILGACTTLPPDQPRELGIQKPQLDPAVTKFVIFAAGVASLVLLGI